jgi:hypothetical protein
MLKSRSESSNPMAYLGYDWTGWNCVVYRVQVKPGIVEGYVGSERKPSFIWARTRAGVPAPG